MMTKPKQVEAGSERLIDGDFIYEQARAFCYGVAGRIFHPAVQFNDRERQIIDAIAEWMGSRDCEIAQLKLAASPSVEAGKQTIPFCVNGTCLYSCADDECKKAVEKGIPWPSVEAGAPTQLSYAGRAPFIYGNPPRGYDSKDAALKALHDRAVKAEAQLAAPPLSQGWQPICDGCGAPADSRLTDTAAFCEACYRREHYLAKLAEVEAQLSAALEYARLEEAVEDFDCPHDADGQCDCGHRQDAMFRRARELRKRILTGTLPTPPETP